MEKDEKFKFKNWANRDCDEYFIYETEVVTQMMEENASSGNKIRMVEMEWALQCFKIQNHFSAKRALISF